MKIPVEKTPVIPHAGAAGQASPGRKTTAPQSGPAASLLRPAAAGKAAVGQTAAGAGRSAVNPGAGSRAVPAAADNRLSGLLSALKLPNDSLSESIVSFSRYFSLPLERASFLRGEVLVQKNRKSSLEAAALGAAAASDKGIVLESRALAEYVEAIDPAEWREQSEQGNQEPEQGNQPEQQNQEQGQPEQESGRRKPEQQETRRQGEGRAVNGTGNERNGSANRELTAEELKRQVSAVLGKGPDFINRIPGKNGRRWIVVPFSFSGDGFDLRASFRISLPDPDGKGAGTGSFAADIAVFREKKLSRRWFFLLEGTCAGEFKAKTAKFFISPPASDNKILIRELAKLFGLPCDKITLNKKGNFTDSRDDLLRTVDEAV